MNTVRMVLVAYCAATALMVALTMPFRRRVFRDAPGEPDRLLGVVRLPRLSATGFDLSGGLLVVSLAGAAAGLATRWMIAAALVLYVLHFGQVLNRSGIMKKTNLLPLYLLVFLVAPGIDAPSVAAPFWPVLATQALLAGTYFAAALAKLRHTGAKWVRGRAMRGYLVDNYLWRGSELTWWVARRPALCATLSGYGLAVEGLFPAALLGTVPAAVLVIAAVGMHLGIQVVMGIDYLRYWWPNYVPFAVPLLLVVLG